MDLSWVSHHQCVIMLCEIIWGIQGVDYHITWWSCDMEMLSVSLMTSSVTSVSPSQRASNTQLRCFLCCCPEQGVEQTVKMPVTWGPVLLMPHHPMKSQTLMLWWFNVLVQERRNSSALAMELHLSCINPFDGHLIFIIESQYLERRFPNLNGTQCWFITNVAIDKTSF